MITKTYQSLKRTSLGLSVIYKGNEYYFTFVNGKTYPDFQGGRFQTSNPTEQKAIESHIRFLRGEIICVDINGKQVDVAPDEPLPDLVMHPNLGSGHDGVGDDQLVYHVNTAAAAKKWLIDNIGAKQSELKNVQAIEAYCLEHKVVFPDWETAKEDRQ